MHACTQCGETKGPEEFGFRNKAIGRRHRRCKTCVAAYGKTHYSANKTTYVVRNNKRSRAHTEVLKEKVWQHLLANPCVDCGITDPVVLEFDHDDPATKRKTIYKLIHQAYSWEAISEEIAKCHVRCANCHRRRTADQFTWPKLSYSPDEPPSKTPVARQILRRPVLVHRRSRTLEQLTRNMKVAGYQRCGWCGRARAPEDFHLRNETTRERQTICAACFTAYRREHYRLNRNAYMARNARLLRERARQWAHRLWKYLRTHPCIDCGETNPVVLEFDHVERLRKRAAVTFLARAGYPWDSVAAEVAKCEVRCANCHRRRTAREFDWPKLHVTPLQPTPIASVV